MQDRKWKYFMLLGYFETDGDYGIRKEKFSDEYRQLIRQDPFDDHAYRIVVESDDIYYVRDFLKELMVSFRVGSGHYWLVPKLYELVNAIYEGLFDDDQNEIYNEIGGNYEGTNLALVKFDTADGPSLEPNTEIYEFSKLIFTCPKCEHGLFTDVTRCIHCGQKIDWKKLWWPNNVRKEDANEEEK